MDKKTFLMLAYIGTLLPLLYLASEYLWRWIIWLAIGNLVLLMVMSIIAWSATASKKRKLLWFLIGAGLVVVGTQYLMQTPKSLPVVEDRSEPEYSQESDFFSGLVLSGENTTPTTGETLVATGQELIDDATESNIVDTDLTPAYEADPVETTTNTTTTTSSTASLPSGLLTYADVIPYLVTTHNLTKAWSSNPTFTNISTTNSLYSPFAIAASRGMIGGNINPGSNVSCNTYLVLKGIAQWRQVTYPAGSPFAAYRAEAVRRWVVNGCADGQFVTKEKL